jgi:ATP/maltotriose-dependent transcriptional regulator MalT
MLAYMILMITVLLAIGGASMAIVASVAVLGLVVIWMFSRTQAKRIEESFLRDEMRTYADLLSRQPSDPSVTSTSTSTSESPLTDRECEVLRRIASGNTNKQIASALNISEQTVKNHISHIFTKMDVADRTSAVLMAMRRGWIRGDDVNQLQPPEV